MLVVDEPPAALVRMQRSREAIQRADIRWSHAYFSELADAGPGERMLYGNKIAGGDIALINDGTEHGGYASFTEDHKPIPESRAAFLRKHDQQWQFESDQLLAMLSPGPPPATA